MDPGARGMYRLLATLFLAIGGGFLVVALVQALTDLRLLDGNALGPALLVLIVGVLLAWTIRGLPRAEAGDAEAPEEAPAAAPDAGAERGRDGGDASPDA